MGGNVLELVDLDKIGAMKSVDSLVGLRLVDGQDHNFCHKSNSARRHENDDHNFWFHLRKNPGEDHNWFQKDSMGSGEFEYKTSTNHVSGVSVSCQTYWTQSTAPPGTGMLVEELIVMLEAVFERAEAMECQEIECQAADVGALPVSTMTWSAALAVSVRSDRGKDCHVNVKIEVMDLCTQAALYSPYSSSQLGTLRFEKNDRMDQEWWLDNTKKVLCQCSHDQWRSIVLDQVMYWRDHESVMQMSLQQ
jgi:hypothetical protein